MGCHRGSIHCSAISEWVKCDANNQRRREHPLLLREHSLFDVTMGRREMRTDYLTPLRRLIQRRHRWC